MTTSPVARLRSRLNEKGATTAEYAAVTAAGAGFGGLLYKFLTSDWGQAMIKSVLDWAFGLIGMG